MRWNQKSLLYQEKRLNQQNHTLHLKKVEEDENFVYIAKIRNGIIVSDVKAESEDNYNKLTDVLALRTKEESGNYIVKIHVYIKKWTLWSQNDCII